MTDGHVIDFITVLSITIPSTLAGVLMIGIFSWFRGKDLDKDDPEFQKLIADPENRKIVYGESATLLGKADPQPVDRDVDLCGAIAVVAIPGCRSIAAAAGQRQAAVHGADHPDVHAAGRCADDHVHQNDPSTIGKTDVFRAGMIAVVAVFRYCLDGRHRVRSAPARAQAHPVRPGEDPALDLCHRVAPGDQQAGQLAGGGHQRHGAGGPGHRRAARVMSWPLPPRPTATTSCQPTPATWPRSSSTVRAPHASASTSSTTASS
jgi:hypothetical protein